LEQIMVEVQAETRSIAGGKSVACL
jgi:hypothetical protein